MNLFSRARFPGHATVPALIAVLATILATLAPSVDADSEVILTGRITIHGNDRIKDYIILRQIPLKPRDPLDYRTLEKARQNLRTIPGMDYSEIRVTYQPEDSAMGLRVFVTEKRAFGGNAWLERGYENQFSIGARATERNFRGRSEKLSAYLVVINNTIFGFDWENPWLGSGRKIGMGLEAYYKSYIYVYDDFDDAFAGSEITRWGGSARTMHLFQQKSRGYLKLSYESIKGDREGVTIDPDGDQFPIFELGVIWDTREGMRFPWAGGYIKVAARAVGPFDDLYSINEGVFDIRGFVPILGHSVLGAHTQVALREGNNIPIYRRQHVGGGKTIRSWEYGLFNGDNSVVGGIEYRIPFNFTREMPLENVLLGVEFHAFADAGAAWQSTRDLSTDIVHGGYGFGFSLLNQQLRGIRFDYGWHKNSSGMFHFEVGLKF